MEDVASRIVDKAIALGCQDAVADVVENRSYQIRFARNEAVISNQWRESNASVFVVHGKRVVASDVRDLSKTDEAVERLVKIAKTSQANPDYAGIAKGPFRYARTRPDPKVLSLNEGGKYVEAAVGGALDQGAKECAGSFWKYEDEHFLATSNGAEGHDHRASLYLSNRAAMGSLVPRSSPSSSRRRPDRKPDESQPWRGPRSRPRRADTQSSSTHSFSVR